MGLERQEAEGRTGGGEKEAIPVLLLRQSAALLLDLPVRFPDMQ